MNFLFALNGCFYRWSYVGWYLLSSYKMLLSTFPGRGPGHPYILLQITRLSLVYSQHNIIEFLTQTLTTVHQRFDETPQAYTCIPGYGFVVA